MQLLYNVLIGFVDIIFDLFIAITSVLIPLVTGLLGTTTIVLPAFLWVLPFVVFWYDTQLFPVYFQAAMGGYIFAFGAVLAINLLYYIKLIPFV